jgi:hypothetical protein
MDLQHVEDGAFTVGVSAMAERAVAHEDRLASRVRLLDGVEGRRRLLRDGCPGNSPDETCGKQNGAESLDRSERGHNCLA